MSFHFIAAPIPGGAAYAAFRDTIDGEEVTVVVADPAQLQALVANPDTIEIPHMLCAAVINGLDKPPDCHLRIVS